MKNFVFLISVIAYVSTGIVLQKMGVTSPALYGTHGWLFGALAVIIWEMMSND